MDTFRDTLERLINQHSMENGSDTPDFILADYLKRCLDNWDYTSRQRENWYNQNKKEKTNESK